MEPSLLGVKEIKAEAGCHVVLVPPSFLLFGFPEFLRLFPRKLS